jgi:hypothetical protein
LRHRHYTMEHSVKRWKDKLGIAASVLCAVHCAATPILLACLPALQLTEWMASPRFHQIAAVVCSSLVAIAIWPTFRRFGDYRVLGLSSAGLALIISAAFFLPDHCCSHGHINHVTIVDEPQNPQESVRLVSTKVDHDPGTCTKSCCADSVFAASRRQAAESTRAAINMKTVGHIHSQHFLGSTWLGELIARVQPWMTPLGGILLIGAHFLNLRRQLSPCGSKCGCHPARQVIVMR